jgi:hypothetical protein
VGGSPVSGSEPMPSRPPKRVVVPEVAPGDVRDEFPVPKPFRPDRQRPAGRYRLLELFQGLERTVPFSKYPGDDRETRRIARSTWVYLNDGPGWMYVAPRRTPPEVRRHGFRMVETPDDAIVVARGHFQNSPLMDVYLDLIHEFLHILQRHQGRELWPARLPYADRPTEVEAYSFSVAEARRLGVSDRYLRAYLHIPWIGAAEFRHLLENVGVPPARRKA